MSQRRVAALIGSPVAHSLSPVIHRAGFEAAGVDWGYEAFDVAPGSGRAAIEAMRTLGLAGLSVTMPHKGAVAEAVDRLDPAAAALGAVNTVSWDGERLVGSSTDGDGFVASLAEHDVTVQGRTIAVIGAGGAARSVIDALGRGGAASIVVINRTPDRGEAAAALAAAASVGDPSMIEGADVVVNATSIGMGADAGARRSALAFDPAVMACDPALLHDGQVVADLVYHPLRTPWLEAAAARRAATIDGLGMLIHQAALQQHCWLGSLPDVAVMRRAAEAVLTERSDRPAPAPPTRPGHARR